MTGEQAVILLALYPQDGVTQRDLCRATAKDQPTMSRILGNMIGRELIYRLPDPGDQRNHRIFLTDRARLIRHHVTGVMKETEQAIFGLGDKAQTDMLFRALKAIVGTTEDMLR